MKPNATLILYLKKNFHIFVKNQLDFMFFDNFSVFQKFYFFQSLIDHFYPSKSFDSVH